MKKLERVNGMLSLSIFFILFLILEAFFRFGMDESDSFGQTLVGQKWKQRHLTGFRNSMGYRDREHPPAALEGKKIIFVVGDSFVEGGGIADVKDRFPDVLQEKLGKDWEVINISKSGWHTENEYRAILDYPLVPQVIVLSHFINDIDHAAGEWGLWPQHVVEEPPRWLAPFLGRSYFLNYFYWRLWEFSRASERYWNYLKAAYSDPRILATHKKELQNLIEFCRAQKIRLVVILFPHLRAVEKTREFIDPIHKFFDENKIEVINLSDRLGKRPFRELIVNAHDSHPSASLHRELGQWLADTLVQ